MMWVARILVFGWAAGLLLGCAHLPPAPPAECTVACANAKNLGCAYNEFCIDNCPTIEPRVRDCVAAAVSCGKMDECDE